MSYRMNGGGGGGHNRNNNNRNGGYGGGGGGGGYGHHMNNNGINRPNPWGNDNSINNGGGGGGNFRQGGGGGGGGGNGLNNDVLSLANSLVNNLLLNQNAPPSLLDLPNRGGNGGGGGNGYGGRGNYGGGGGGGGGYDDRMNRGNRHVGSNQHHNHHHHNNHHNRRNGPPGARHGNKPDKLNVINKGGIRKRNPVAITKKVLAKNSANDSKQQHPHNQSEEPSSNKKSKVESRYADVPNVMFYCHMCKKHMWDAASFENHVKGRTHMMMKDGVEESYRLRANMIRQEAKNEEQLKTIELERLKRLGKNAKGNQRREYCTMCDLHFFGHLSSHRKTDGHLQLKKFLHPRCGECCQEFSNRIDFDTHLLMPEHMKKAFLTKSNKPERRKNALIISTEEEERKDLKEEKEVRKQAEAAKKLAAEEAAADGDDPMEDDADKTVNSENVDDDEAADKTEDGGEDEKADEDKADAEASVEADDVILDFKEGEEIPVEVEGKIPKYNCLRQIGYSMLHKLDCFECHLCGRFFDTAITAEIHSRTVTHHRNFVKFLNDKSNDTKIAEKRAAAAIEESERKKRKLVAAQNKEATKAATVAAAAAATDAPAEGSASTDANDTDMTLPEGDKSYDPLEASVDEDLDESKTDIDAVPVHDDDEVMLVENTPAVKVEDATVDEEGLAVKEEVPDVEAPAVVKVEPTTLVKVEPPTVVKVEPQSVIKVESPTVVPVEPATVLTPPSPNIRTPTRATPNRSPRFRGRGGRK